jgi:hypothetical protein
MKKILSIFLLSFLAFSSCDEDELEGIPALPPRITIKFGGAVVAYVGTDLTATITDGANSPVSNVKMEIVSENGASVASKEITSGFEAGPNSVTWKADESKIATFAPGNYKLKVTATDTKNKQSVGEVSLPVLDLKPECKQQGKVTIVLIAPDPAEGSKIGFVGSPTNWGSAAGTDIVFNKIVNGVYCAAVEMSAGAQFKFRLNENWGTQEGKNDAGCSDGDNRSYSGNGNDLIVQTVPRWKPCN